MRKFLFFVALSMALTGTALAKEAAPEPSIIDDFFEARRVVMSLVGVGSSFVMFMFWWARRLQDKANVQSTASFVNERRAMDRFASAAGGRRPTPVQSAPRVREPGQPQRQTKQMFGKAR